MIFPTLGTGLPGALVPSILTYSTGIQIHQTSPSNPLFSHDIQDPKSPSLSPSIKCPFTQKTALNDVEETIDEFITKI